LTNTNNCDIILTGWGGLSEKKLGEMRRIVARAIRVQNIGERRWAAAQVNACIKYPYCDNCPFDLIRCNNEMIGATLCAVTTKKIITLEEVLMLVEHEMEKR